MVSGGLTICYICFKYFSQGIVFLFCYVASDEVLHFLIFSYSSFYFLPILCTFHLFSFYGGPWQICALKDMKMSSPLHYFLIKTYFYWGIIALQCCIGFFHMSTWISHRHTYVPSVFNLPSTFHPIQPLYRA